MRFSSTASHASRKKRKSEGCVRTGKRSAASAASLGRSRQAVSRPSRNLLATLRWRRQRRLHASPHARLARVNRKRAAAHRRVQLHCVLRGVRLNSAIVTDRRRTTPAPSRAQWRSFLSASGAFVAATAGEIASARVAASCVTDLQSTNKRAGSSSEDAGDKMDA